MCLGCIGCKEPRELSELHLVQEHLQHNRFILTGYRTVGSYKESLPTLFSLSNETGNIWSHLIATLIFFALPFHLASFANENNLSFSTELFMNPFDTISDVGPDVKATLPIFPWIIFFLSVITAFSTSAAYHLFNCISYEHYLYWMRMDLIGVTTGICGSAFTGLYFSFKCHPYIQQIYLYSIAIFFLYALYLQQSPHFISERYTTRRLILYGFLMGFGLVPSIHWTIISPPRFFLIIISFLFFSFLFFLFTNFLFSIHLFYFIYSVVSLFGW